MRLRAARGARRALLALSSPPSARRVHRRIAERRAPARRAARRVRVEREARRRRAVGDARAVHAPAEQPERRRRRDARLRRRPRVARPDRRDLWGAREARGDARGAREPARRRARASPSTEGGLRVAPRALSARLPRPGRSHGPWRRTGAAGGGTWAGGCGDQRVWGVPRLFIRGASAHKLVSLAVSERSTRAHAD